jgi:hypothetical protein
MNEKMRIFLELAGKMNRKFSVIPLLYGSMGLQMQLDEDLQPDDIDICVPQHLYLLNERWHDLLEFMRGEGYELMDEHEHFFQKGEIGVNFGVIDGYTSGIPSLEAFTGIDPMEIPIRETDGAIYRLLTLEQYYRVYTQSMKDNYRNREGDGKDRNKIEILQKKLGISG